MRLSCLSILVFCNFSIFFFLCTQARWHHHHHHHHTKHKHSHYHPHKVSTISAPPENADPPYASFEPADPPSFPPESDSPSYPPPETDYPPSFPPENATPPEPTNPPSFPPEIASPPYPPPKPAYPVNPPSSPYRPAEPANPPSSPPETLKLPPSPSPVPASSPEDDGRDYNSKALNVRKFGAVGDGITDDTDALKMAWDAACNQNQNDSALILVPYGFKFMIQSTIFTGPCQGGIVFQIDGTIMPPDGPESWPQKNSKRQWLVFYRVDHMSLLGGGTIDGRGEKWWDLPCKPHKGINGTTLPGPCDSPIAIRFFMSSNLTVQGLRVKNSPQFNFRFDSCKNLHIDSIHITAPALSPNTDGIHIENTNNVQIYDSVISNGDDCVSIGSGCYDVDIRNITCGPSHGISIGSLGNHESKACVSNITVRDSVIKVSDNGVRIKTWQGGSGAVTGITFSNIHMDNVRNPIIIDQFYCLAKDCTNKTSAVFVSDILYENIKGTYNIRSPPMHFACSDSVPCTNLTLLEVELLPAQGDLVLDPFCWNAYGQLQTLTIPPVSCLMEGTPSSLLNNDLNYC